jgi:uroporphyrinogen decarboxylase
VEVITMNSRERVLAALNHTEPDRVPFDMGGTVITGIHYKAYAALRDYLGLPNREPKIIDMIQQLALVEDDVMERLGVDMKNISPRSSASFNIVVKEMGEYTCFYDEFQIGWRMPKDGGWYYDMYDHPLQGDVTEADIEDYRFPDARDPVRFAGLREAALRIANEEKRAVVFGNISAGIFEMYTWLRGYKAAYTEWAEDPKMASKLMRRIFEMQLAYWEKALPVVGDVIDVAQCADDVAGQNGMLISPRSYRKLLKPLHKELFDYIHARTNAKIFFHSCGTVRAIIPDLIEVGVDILNPVQVSATGMDSAELKREYGKDLTFWGGGVDTQRVFGTGTPQEVREDVKRHVTDLMPGGGFVFNTVHNIQGNVPPENIMAMWETLQEYGVYGK